MVPRRPARAAPHQDGNSIDAVFGKRTIRKPTQKVYFWPSLTERERGILRDAFFQIGRRTCIKFEEQEYKPWFHADRWIGDQPYVLIRKSKKYAAYSDNAIEGLVDRTILYIAEGAFQMGTHNHSRGAVMDQLVRFMGMKKEMYRPDAASYIQPIAYRLTQYCPARNDVDIGAGQRVGLLTKWDTIKLNTMYCPERVNADPQRGPCVVPRAKDAEEFKRRSMGI
ncbi:unnamed protein product [Strongylus vulgaris]|uniref:Peptidase M12A domain-containing protein n=1 Tax=Strongylus vulgaris TaxID=40348 RepID=A0A3P7JKK7_STRVU|nr:unnamed protein product [Strongylus vulgaris]